MKKTVTILILLVGTVLSYLFFYEPQYDGLVVVPGRPQVYAHRGFGDLAPDNALTSAKLAMENDMDGVDVDGQFTADQQLVIYHDLSVDRLTSGTGKVQHLTLAELKTLDLNESFGDLGFEGSFVASFEDFVQEITPDGILMVELKIPGASATGIEAEAARIIEKYDAHERVYISSFNPLVLYRLKRLDGRIQTVMIFMDSNWNDELRAEIAPEDFVPYPWPMQQEWVRRAIRKFIKPDALSVNVEVSPDTRERLLEKGWPIFLWTINEEEDIRAALSENPLGVISDQPLRLKAIRDEMYP